MDNKTFEDLKFKPLSKVGMREVANIFFVINNRIPISRIRPDYLRYMIETGPEKLGEIWHKSEHEVKEIIRKELLRRQ